MQHTIDFSSKRAKLALRFFTYGMMTVITAVLTTLLILIALGYQFNRSDLSFTQGGLVQLRTIPEEATITIDGKAQSFRTPGKVNLEAGAHTLTMARQGYHDWSKDFNLAAGQLAWFNYARLIPTTLKTSTLRQFDAVHNASASPDRRWLLVQHTPSTPQFTLLDYEDRAQPDFTTITLPDQQLTKENGALGSFELVEWDLDSRFVLIKHILPGSIEFIRLDRAKPAEAVNLTKLFDLNILEAHFAGNSANIVYAKTDSVLRRLDIGSTNASSALATGLRDFVVYGSSSIALTHDIEQPSGDTAIKVQEIAIYEDDRLVPVRTVSLEQQVIFDYNEYDDHEYLAVGHAASPAIDIIRDPTEQGQKDAATVFATLDLGVPLTWLSFSGNGRMVVAQHEGRLASYDLEEAKSYRADLTFEAPVIEQRLRWLDDYYLWATVGGAVWIVEFDGTNSHKLGAAQTGPGVMLNQDGTRLLSVGSQDNKSALKAVQLTTSSDE